MSISLKHSGRWTPPDDAPVASRGFVPAPVAREELGRNGRLVLTGGVVIAHLVAGWALLQVDAVRQVVASAVPTIMVDMIAPPEPAKPPPPPPPLPAPQLRRQLPTPAPIIAAAPTPAPPSFVVAAPDPVPVEPAPPSPPAPPAPPEVKAPPAAALKVIAPSAVRYLTPPKLNFPLMSKRANEYGIVVLRIAVDASGRLKEALIQKSSGFDRLDQQALSDIRSARFVPQTEDGKPIEWETLAPLAYEH